jgi:hypothetical protein
MFDKIKLSAFLIMLLIIILLIGFIGIQNAFLFSKNKLIHGVSSCAKNQKILDEKYNAVLKFVGTPEFEKEFKKVKFDPTLIFNSNESFNTIPIIILDYYGVENETDIEKIRIKYRFNFYYVINQVMHLTNYSDLRERK